MKRTSPKNEMALMDHHKVPLKNWNFVKITDFSDFKLECDEMLLRKFY